MVVSLTLILIMLLSLSAISSGAAFENNTDDASVMSSEFLSMYYVTLQSGSQSGTLSVNFAVSATASVSQLGISQIQVYKENGSYVKTIGGTTFNGLIARNAAYHTGSYVIQSLTPGASYYIIATAYASTGGNNADFKDVLTTTAQAGY